MTRNVRRAAAGAILIAVACNVYDPSLLVGGNSGGAGGAGGAGAQGGSGGSGGSGGTGGSGGSSGSGGSTGGSTAGAAPVTGGAGGATAGAAGKGGGSSGVGGKSGTAGMESMAGEAGEAGMGQGGTGGAGSGGMGGSAATGAGGIGTGGTAGSGTSGAGGTAGMSGSGGSAGSSAGMGGAAGSDTATGCAAMSVPLATSTDIARFDISFSTPMNLSSATITTRVYVSAGSGGSIFNFIQDSTSSFHFLTPTTTTTIASVVGKGWKTLTWNVGSQGPGGTGIVLTTIKRVGFEVSAGGGGSSWTNPTVVYLDSVTIDTPAESFTFDTSASVANPAALTGDPMGSTAMWLNSSDSPVANTALTWVATCP